MPELPEDEPKLIRYLLGDELSEAEVQRIEAAYIDNDAYFEALEKLEDRLIDDYLNNRLSPPLLELFEKNFLASPRRRRRVEVIRGMKEFFTDDPELSRRRQTRSEAGKAGSSLPPKTGWTLRWSLAPALLALSCVGLLVLSSFQYSQIQSLRTEASRFSLAPPGDMLPRLVLFPGVQRSLGTMNTIVVHSRHSTLEMRLKLGSGRAYQFVQVTLETPEGQPVFRHYRLVPQAEDTDVFVDVSLPSAAVPTGDYVLSAIGFLEGTEEHLPSYVFRVQRR